jgi:hypothetical protein
MIEDVKPGDLIATSGKRPVSLLIQAATLGVPNIGPLGRWGWAGISHVAVIAPVFGEPLVYESTSFPRSTCVRTGRQAPIGVQAHTLSTILESGGDVWHYPLRRELYVHEEDRLLLALESCLGRGYDTFGAGKAGGAVINWLIRRTFGRENIGSLFCSELVAHAWSQVGIIQCPNASTWNPAMLVRYARRKGIVGPGRLLS